MKSFTSNYLCTLILRTHKKPLKLKTNQVENIPLSFFLPDSAN